jgi:TRAP transporter TAXI family solute receptor
MRARVGGFVAAMCMANTASQAQTSPFEVAQYRPVPRAATAASIGEGQAVAKINNWTVGLASGLPEGTFIQFGAEIARNLNNGEELRVIPMVTYGATENVKDLLHLKGVDIAFTNADVLEHFRTVEKIPNIEKRIHFVSGMYIGHIHLLVRSDITSLKDLEGKKVSFHTPGAGASVSGPILFQRLGIKVEPVPVNNAIAMEKMKTGELAGLVNTGGKPQDLFTKFKNDYGYKFLSVPYDKFEDLYVPSVFTSEDYPGYIKPGERVEALGVPVVLAVYNWPKESDRFRRIQRFIEYFFDRFDGFQKPPYHPACARRPTTRQSRNGCSSDSSSGAKPSASNDDARRNRARIRGRICAGRWASAEADDSPASGSAASTKSARGLVELGGCACRSRFNPVVH